MASKMIRDEPALLNETLISLTEACKCFPVRCSRAALERWVRRGRGDVTLETVRVCGRRYTSQEAIDRFIRNQLQVKSESIVLKRGSKSKKEIADAIKKFGLPEPE